MLKEYANEDFYKNANCYREHDFKIALTLDIFFEKVTAHYLCRCEVYGSGRIECKRASLYFDGGEVELSDTLFNQLKPMIEAEIEKRHEKKIEVISYNIEHEDEE